MESSYNDFINMFYRDVNLKVVSGITTEEAQRYYLSDDYETYFVEYTGNPAEKLQSIDFAHILLLNIFFAVLFVKEGRLSDVLRKIPEIVNVERRFPYTLFNLNESKELADLNSIAKMDIPLDGEGVVVGIIGTGIDYLNPKFMDKNGNTRIISLWDQSLTEGNTPKTFLHGTEYTREDINRAIKAQILGKNPYDIVKQKDEVGNGTAIAAIIGGSELEKSDDLVSVAPKCDFIIVKLKEGSNINRKHWGLENYKGLFYDSSDVSSAVRYLYQLQQKLNKPVVIYITVGANFGPHDGSTIIERYINFITEQKALSVVTTTGNQGGSPICFKYNFSEDEREKVVDIKVDKNQNNLFFSAYFASNDRITIGITSPQGETVDKIPLNKTDGEEVTITLGKSSIYVQCFYETRGTGSVRLDFVIRNAEGGIWKLNVTKEYAIRGSFNVWLQQKEFSFGDTGLVEFSEDTTLMTPSTAKNIIVTSSYNKNENKVMEESGRGFTIDNRVAPCIAITAKNIPTVGLNNKPIVVTGTAVSGAILAGVVALLYQWGIVMGNDLNMFVPKIKSYLLQGTVKEEGTLYPNPDRGLGVLEIYDLFKKLYKREMVVSQQNNETKPNLYINIPMEILKRVHFSKSKSKI